MFRRKTCGGVLVVGLLAAGVASAQVLGSVRLQAVMADGQRLEARIYEVRLIGAVPERGGGQSRGAERWVDFVKNGTVAGREVATVIPANEIAGVAEGTPPARNAVRADMLKGGDYVRNLDQPGHGALHHPSATRRDIANERVRGFPSVAGVSIALQGTAFPPAAP